MIFDKNGLKSAFFLDKTISLGYIHNNIFIICKGKDEEEYALPLKRESGCGLPGLKGCLKEGMWKVASEPEG